MVKIMEVKQPRVGKNGKTYWHKVGVKFVSDDGKESIKLDALPLPNERGEVWLNVFEQRPREDAGASGTWSKPEAANESSQQNDSSNFNDEIPF